MAKAAGTLHDVILLGAIPTSQDLFALLRMGWVLETGVVNDKISIAENLLILTKERYCVVSHGFHL